MEQGADSGPQWIYREWQRTLADVRFAEKKALTTLHAAVDQEVPTDDAREQMRHVLTVVEVAHELKNDEQHAGHNQRLQQRPADAEERTAVQRPQIHLYERQPEVAVFPDRAQMG